MRILEQCFRIYSSSAELEDTISYYEKIQGVKCARRVLIVETGVVAAKIGNFLLLAGDGEAMITARQVNGIFYVDNLDAFAAWIPNNGGEILHGPHEVTSGRNFTARHPDGLTIEYFERSI